jgi:hypothetical protein
MKKEKNLDEFSGEWILLLNDKIIDHSYNIEDMLKLAEEKYPEEKYPDNTIKISKVLSGDFQLH